MLRLSEVDVVKIYGFNLRAHSLLHIDKHVLTHNVVKILRAAEIELQRKFIQKNFE